MTATQWNSEEHSRLRGLSLLARVIYLLVFRRRMNYVTGISGGPGNKIDYQAIVEESDFVPDVGSTKKRWKPGKEEVRAAIRELERVGLMVDVGSSRQNGYYKRLIHASLNKSNQKRNPAGTPQEPRSEIPASSTTGNPVDVYDEYSCSISALELYGEEGSHASTTAESHASYSQPDMGMSPRPQVSGNRNSVAANTEYSPRAHVDDPLFAALQEMFPDHSSQVDTHKVQEMLVGWSAVGVQPEHVRQAVKDVQRRNPNLAFGPLYIEGVAKDLARGKVVYLDRPPWAQIPREDNKLMAWAKEYGYPGPGTMTDREYQQLLRSEVDKRLFAEGLK